MSIENSIDRLAAAIEKLASAVSAPVVVVVTAPSQCAVEVNPVRVEPRPATEAEKAEFEANPPPEVKKPRGRPRKQGNVEIISQEGVTVETQPLVPQDPPPATQTADTAEAVASSSETQTSEPASASDASRQEPSLSKGDIVQILTGLQKKLEESATTVEEKRGAAQKCRDLIKSVVGSESLKDAKPEHFGRIKSAVLKVLNND